MVNRLFPAAFATALLFCSLASGQTPEPSSTLPEDPVPSPETGEQGEAQQAFFEGLRYLRDEQWARAEASFRRSLALVPRTSARYNLALVLFKQQHARESLLLLDELLAAPVSAE